MCQSYLEENEYLGIISNIQSNWEYTNTCLVTLGVIEDCINDFCYMLDREELMDEIEFLQHILICINQMEE